MNTNPNIQHTLKQFYMLNLIKCFGFFRENTFTSLQNLMPCKLQELQFMLIEKKIVMLPYT